MEADVEVSIGLLLEIGGVKSAEQVKTLGAPVQLAVPNLDVPNLDVPKVDLSIYDALLTSGVGT